MPTSSPTSSSRRTNSSPPPPPHGVSMPWFACALPSSGPRATWTGSEHQARLELAMQVANSVVVERVGNMEVAISTVVLHVGRVLANTTQTQVLYLVQQKMYAYIINDAWRTIICMGFNTYVNYNKPRTGYTKFLATFVRGGASGRGHSELTGGGGRSASHTRGRQAFGRRPIGAMGHDHTRRCNHLV